MKTKSLFYLVIILLFFSCKKRNPKNNATNNSENSQTTIIQKLNDILKKKGLSSYKIVPQYFKKDKMYWVSGLKNLKDGQKLPDYLFCDFDNDGNKEVVAFLNSKELQKNDVGIFDLKKERVNLLSNICNENSGDAKQLVQYFPTKNYLDWKVIKIKEIDCTSLHKNSQNKFGVLINEDFRNNNGIHIFYSDGKYKVDYHTE